MFFDSRLWRTFRHQKAEQIYRRPRSKLSKPTPDLRASQPRRAAPGSWVTPAMREVSFVERRSNVSSRW
jgi:hypothetical protein